MICGKRDYFGVFLFAVGVLICIYMFLSPATSTFIHIDEFWTYTLLKLSWHDAMIVIVNDVHPPLYYGIVLLFSLVFGTSNIYLLKIASIIPYILIMIVGYYKICADYGWFTYGLFIFCIGTMSDFYVEFLTMRMYSWGLFFVLMAFFYYREVINMWERRSWVLLTVFTLFSAYTQYYFGVTCGLMYLLILIKIIKDPTLKDKMKQFKKSFIALVICYAPWLVVLIHQILTHPTGFEKLNLASILNYVTYFAIKDNGYSFKITFFKIIAFVFLVLILALIYKKRDELGAVSVFLMYATIVVGAVIFMFTFIYIRVRYLIPVIGIFWLAVSILLGKLQNNKLLAMMLALVLILAGASIVISHDDIESRLEYNSQRDAFMESINNNDSVVVYNTDFGYQAVHESVNNTKQYSLGDTYFYFNDTEICKSMDTILEKNHDKNIYLVNWDQNNANKKYEKEYHLTQKYDAKHYTVNLVEKRK